MRTLHPKKHLVSLICFFALQTTFAQQPKLVLPIGHTDAVNSAYYSPDGNKLVTASWDGTAKIWDAVTGKLLADLAGHTNGVSSASFSPDGNKIVTASGDKTAKIWDAVTGKLLADLSGHTNTVLFASFSPDGKKIVTASRDKTTKIWDAVTGKLLTNLKGHASGVNSASFSPEGKKVVTASVDKTAKIWDTVTGKLLADLAGHTDWVFFASFSPDGKKIVTASLDKTSKIWDAVTGKLITNLNGHYKSVSFASFSPDGNKIVTASVDKTAKIWDAVTGKLLTNLAGHTDFVRSASFSPDGNKIVTASYDSTAKIWDALTGKLLADLAGHTESVSFASFSPDGNKIVTASDDNTAKIWDAVTGRLLADLAGHTYNVYSASFSPEGNKIVTASDANTAMIWDAVTGKLLAELHGHTAEVYSALFSPNGKKIVTASGDTTAKIWDVVTGKLLADLVGHTAEVYSASFSPDGNKIITGSRDYTAKIWDAVTGKLLTDLDAHTDGVSYASFSLEGKKVVTASGDKTAKIWDAVTGKLLADLAGHTKSVESAFFSPDGNKIVTASYDSTAKIWDAVTGKLLANLAGHTNSVFSASFSPDGKKIVTASVDKTAKIWDAVTGRLLSDLAGHTDWVYFASFSPDGNKIVTASGDNTSKIWDSDSGNLSYTFFVVDSTDYLVIDKHYRFDGTPNARKLLYFTCGTEVIELDQLKDQLWVPELAERISRGEQINGKKLEDLNLCELIPEVQNLGLKNDQYSFSIKPRRGGLGQVLLRVNGIDTKRYDTSQLRKTLDGYELVVSKKDLLGSFKLGESNIVSLKAYTSDNSISARGVEVEELSTEKSLAPPDLYAVMVGVSKYKGEDLDLLYAAKDAKDMGNAVKVATGKLLNNDGNDHVFVYDLTTSSDRYQLPEKNSIRKVFEDIGQRAKANDILMIFFAGHGVKGSENGQFYFLTADASSSTAVSAIKEVGISMEELSDWMQPQKMRAQKRIMILDACNSGQAIRDFVKMGGNGQGYIAGRSDDKAQLVKAIDRLNEQSGMFILSASASDQRAYEMGKYSQGLLTYSLLRAMKEQPDILDQGKYLDLGRWFHAAEETVKDLSRESGARQQPQVMSTTNFNIGIVDEEVRTKIILPMEKLVFASSILQNADENISSDDLGLNGYLNKNLNELSARGTDAQIVYMRDQSAQSWVIGGRYEVVGKEVRARVNVRQGNETPAIRFEVKGLVDDLKRMAKEIAERSVSLIKGG